MKTPFKTVFLTIIFLAAGLLWAQVAEDFDETGKDSLVIYDIVNDQLVNPQENAVPRDMLEFQNDTQGHQDLWKLFASLIPASARREIVKFSVFTDGIDENLASVTPLPENSDQWILAMDLQDTTDLQDLYRTLIHEFGHVVTLSATQVPRDDQVLANPDDEDLFDEAQANCPQFFTGEGCSLPQSYINLFFQDFWFDIYDESLDAQEGELFSSYPDEFVTEYASTNPGEDITESWTAFVLDPRPAGDTIAQQKVLFFYDFPELVALRERILANMAGQDGGRQQGGASTLGAAAGPAATGPAADPTVADVEAACSGSFDVSETEAPVRFAITGGVAIMRGVIDAGTPGLVERLIRDNPEVNIIVMAYVPGSDDDDANLEASRMIRNARVATCVPRGGEVDSGGTDFFLAGAIRRLADDSVVGVHSWSSGDGLEGRDLPRDDPEHDSFLSYYREIGISPDFYWFTLDAAPADGMHNMTTQERQRFGLETP